MKPSINPTLLTDNGKAELKLTDVGKRFNRDWIFRNFNYSFNNPKKYAITGPNGSGKSTLLQVIAGATMHNKGQIAYTINQKKFESEQHFKFISIAAPYLELIEEMTAKEMLHFHTSFKSMLQSVSFEVMLETVGLQSATNKQLRYFSSGMKQRLKLALAFFSSAPILLLDEPTTNLDAEGIELYHFLINNYTTGKLVIVSSNVKQEYDFCEDVIDILAYK